MDSTLTHASEGRVFAEFAILFEGSLTIDRRSLAIQRGLGQVKAIHDHVDPFRRCKNHGRTEVQQPNSVSK